MKLIGTSFQNKYDGKKTFEFIKGRRPNKQLSS